MDTQTVYKRHYNLKDLTGQKFGRLTVVDYAGSVKGVAYWKCLCDCGVVRERIQSRHLCSGTTKSCGCLGREVLLKVHTVHGMYHLPENKVWNSMKQRCLNPRCHAYEDYGGRGITVCRRWIDSFADFYADVGPRPSAQHSLDRIDNDGNYEPGNVRWSTMSQQNRNMRSNKIVTHNGASMLSADWARRCGVTTTVFCRWMKRYGSDVAIEMCSKSIAERLKFREASRQKTLTIKRLKKAEALLAVQ